MNVTSHINLATTLLGDQFNQLEPDSITLEEGELLYALVRMRKPQLAIETGTGHGFGTRAIGDALSANGKGQLISCDTDAEIVEDAQISIPSLFVKIKHMTGLTLLESLSGKAEFILIDADSVDNRMAEIKLIVEKDLLVKEGTLVIHDTHKEKYRPLVDYVKGLGWTYMIFDSLAGIAVFQKP
jgi:predicted O-methyltransferase YrrM